MVPFHKIYSKIFKSFNIESESEAINGMIEEGVSKIMIIKRSWIFGLAMIWIPIVIVIIGSINIVIILANSINPYLSYPILIGVILSLILFISSVIVYLVHFRKIYDMPRVENKIEEVMPDIEAGDTYFINFFNQTILNQIILTLLIIWTIAFYTTHLTTTEQIINIVSIILLLLQAIFLGRYRKRMMDLEMDYNIVIPGKILFVNQSGMLSSSQAVEGEKVKTVIARYPSWIASVFQYGTIEIMTEGGESNIGTTSMYYVPHPNETAFLIQTLLSPETEEEKGIKNNISSTQEKTIEKVPKLQGVSIGPREVSYDVKGVVRDVLR